MVRKMVSFDAAAKMVGLDPKEARAMIESDLALGHSLRVAEGTVQAWVETRLVSLAKQDGDLRVAARATEFLACNRFGYVGF